MLLCMTSVEQASVSRAPFGTLQDGSAVDLYTLKTSLLEVRLMSYGARVVAIEAPDRDGKIVNVTLGYNTLDEYLTKRNSFFGVTVGRFANRIAKGQFNLDGQSYQLPLNNGVNSLHGGVPGFDQLNWTAKEIPSGVEFTLISADGDQGYPGTMTATVSYTLAGDTLRQEYTATTDKPTIVNLTNHAFFNLAGEGNPSILDDELTLEADFYTPIDGTLIPTGEIAPVGGTPFDFTQPTAIGSRIDKDNEQLAFGVGYDHNFVVRGTPGHVRPTAKVYNPASGRVLIVETDQPGVQFYSGNFLNGSLVGASDKAYVKRSALCLETQHFPDAPNHPNFPNTELRPGQTYNTVTTWTFTTEE